MAIKMASAIFSSMTKLDHYTVTAEQLNATTNKSSKLTE